MSRDGSCPALLLPFPCLCDGDRVQLQRGDVPCTPDPSQHGAVSPAWGIPVGWHLLCGSKNTVEEEEEEGSMLCLALQPLCAAAPWVHVPRTLAALRGDTRVSPSPPGSRQPGVSLQSGFPGL